MIKYARFIFFFAKLLQKNLSLGSYLLSFKTVLLLTQIRTYSIDIFYIHKEQQVVPFAFFIPKCITSADSSPNVQRPAGTNNCSVPQYSVTRKGRKGDERKEKKSQHFEQSGLPRTPTSRNLFFMFVNIEAIRWFVHFNHQRYPIKPTLFLAILLHG